ncbi:hypothetical protein Rin_00017860, partial [Candidatus Regiella insecticola 5.15]
RLIKSEAVPAMAVLSAEFPDGNCTLRALNFPEN